MNPTGVFNGNTLSISWSPIPDASDYAVSVERCEYYGHTRCAKIWTREIRSARQTELVASSHDFGPCTSYNLQISASSKLNARFRVRETSPILKECPQWGILFASIGVAALLVLLGLCALLCYRRKVNIKEIQRARSKVYTRLYTKDKYERPFDQEEFLRKAPELLREAETSSCPEAQESLLEEGGGGGNLLISEDSQLAQEFRDLEILAFDTIQRRTRVANSASNRKRNRYQDVVPFDSTRVKLRSPLKTEEETDSSDYINASYIAGFVSVHSTCTSRIRGDSCISSGSGSNGGGGKSNLNNLNNNNSSSSSSSKNPSRHGSPRKCRSYIAAQGPSNGTLPLFWDMIWEENVRVIVMLTNCVEGGLKCSLYWPHLLGGSRRFFNNIQVLLYDVQEAPDYTIRKFDVSKAEEERSSSSSREIVQIQYKAWPDRTAPRDPRDLLQLIQVTRALANMYNSNEGPGPILVHCSAGVGRSGTFIAVDQLTRMIDCDKNSKIDIFHIVYQLRRDRRHMVQTLPQYSYLYKCILHHLLEKRKSERHSAVEGGH